MNAKEKNRITQEIQMQMFALKRINLWKIIAIVISAIGVLLAYNGFSGAHLGNVAGGFGVLITAISFIAALIFNLGIKNGRANVAKMMAVLEQE